ncbi:MAG: PIG-L deacetylase family protein [Candidatus Woesearchaeota archaeon]
MARKKIEILTIGAHNDDYVVGAGGTLVKYTKENKNFQSIVFSYGEMSHPHYKEKVSIPMRVKESHRADKILGGSGVIYLGIKEGTFLEHKEMAKNNIRKVIEEQKPEKIFTHTSNDPHPDHIAVNSIVMELLEEINFKGDVYSFDVWNILNFKKNTSPQLVVDIKDTFWSKMNAFKAHKSQRVVYMVLVLNLYIKAFLNGLKHGHRYCEVFNRIR